MNHPGAHGHRRPLRQSRFPDPQAALWRHPRQTHGHGIMDTQCLLQTGLKERQFDRVVVFYHPRAAAPVSPLGVSYLIPRSPPQLRAPGHVVQEALGGARDRVGAGADVGSRVGEDIPLGQAVGVLSRGPEPVRDDVEARVGAGPPVGEGAEGRVEQVAPRQQPRGEGVEGGQLDGPEVRGDGVRADQPEVRRDAAADVLARGDVAERPAEEDLAEQVEGEEGDVPVQLHGLLGGGGPVHPPEEPCHEAVHGFLGLQRVGERVARGELPGELDLALWVDDGHGVLVPPVREGAHLVHVALLERCEEDSSDGVGVADADLVVGQADKVSVLVVGLGELLILVSVEGDADVPQPGK